MNFKRVLSIFLAMVLIFPAPISTIAEVNLGEPSVTEKVSVAEARNVPSGQVVKTEGIVTFIEATGDAPYRNISIQDETGGIVVRLTAENNEVQPGDLVEVSGTRGAYKGLEQINVNSSDFKITQKSDGSPLPFKTVTISDILENSKSYESQRVFLEGVKFDSVNLDGASKVSQNGAVMDLYRPNDKDALSGLKAGDIADVYATIGVFNSIQLRIQSGNDITVKNTDPNPDPEIPEEPSVISIEEAKKKSMGTEVTVEGIITYRDEKGGGNKNLTIEGVDGNGKSIGGIAIRLSEINDALKVGDKVKVKGTLGEFRGLIQINENEITVLSSNNTLPSTKATLEEIFTNQDKFISMRVYLEDVEFKGDYTDGNIPIVQGDKSINIYRPNKALDIKNGDRANIYGIVSIHYSLQLRVDKKSHVTKVSSGGGVPEIPKLLEKILLLMNLLLI